MQIKKILIICVLLFLQKICSGMDSKTTALIICGKDQKVYSVSISKEELNKLVQQRPSPLLQLFHKKQKKNRKITAAILAFPLPFGIVGLHRIYLGTAPYVPVTYIASVGGAFGLLPLIDFCVLLADKKTEPYVDNKKVFMWIE